MIFICSAGQFGLFIVVLSPFGSNNAGIQLVDPINGKTVLLSIDIYVNVI
jgi:hypothetical protein